MGRRPLEGASQLDRSTTQGPFRRHNLKPAVCNRFVYEEFRQNAETEPGHQRGQHGVAIVHPQGADRAHHKCISADGREKPCLAWCGDVSNAPAPRVLKRMCRAAVPCEMAWGVATRKRDTGAKVRPIKEESGRDAMRMAGVVSLPETCESLKCESIVTAG